MRTRRSFGLVATACLALGLGVGIGSAAVSEHITSSRSDERRISTQQWDESYASNGHPNAETVIDGRDGDQHRSSDGKQETSRHVANSKRTRAQKLWVKWVTFFAHCGCTGKGHDDQTTRPAGGPTVVPHPVGTPGELVSAPAAPPGPRVGPPVDAPAPVGNDDTNDKPTVQEPTSRGSGHSGSSKDGDAPPDGHTPRVAPPSPEPQQPHSCHGWTGDHSPVLEVRHVAARHIGANVRHVLAIGNHRTGPSDRSSGAWTTERWG